MLLHNSLASSLMLALLFISGFKYSFGQFFTNYTATVKLAYCSILGRCPDPIGLQYFTSVLQLSGQAKLIVNNLAMSQEFEQKNIYNNQNAIDNIYLKILGRSADLSGRSAWNRILQMLGYRYVVNQLMDSAEYMQKYGLNSVPGTGTCQGC